MDALWGILRNGLGNAQFGFAPALASALLHALWQCAAIAAIAALALRMLSRSNAAVRHTAGMLFLFAMAAVPAGQFLLFWREPAADVNNAIIPAMTTMDMAAGGDVFVQQSSDLAIVLSLSWMLGAIAMLLRHLGGWWLIGRLQRRAFEPLPPQWQARLDTLRQKMRISREVMAQVVEHALVPFTAGLLRPVIWIPRSLFAQLPREQIEALLAHELAHIQRLDWLWNGLQCLVECLLFFHPAAWWLNRRIREEREHACDDLAVAACADAIVLAEALTALAHDRRPLPRQLLAGDGGSLTNRISRLLSLPPAGGRRWAPAGLTALLATSALLAAQLQPSKPQVPRLRIESSTDGVLKPGDYRSISANGLDKRRDYRARVDAQGRVFETYQENGANRPIDAPTRTWIDEISRLSVPSSASASRWAAEQAARDAEEAARRSEQTARTKETAARDAEEAARRSEQAARMKETAARDAEEALRRSEHAMRMSAQQAHDADEAMRASAHAADDAEQAMRDSEEAMRRSKRTMRDSEPAMGTSAAASAAILRLVAANASVTNKIGTPVVLSPAQFTGSWGFNERSNHYEQAQIAFALSGPRGRVSIRVSAIAMRSDKQWKITKLEVNDFVPARLASSR